MLRFPSQNAQPLFSSRSVLVSALIVALAAILLYGPFLRNPLVFDDVNLFDGKPHPEYLGAIFSFTLRWLPYASFDWTRIALGPDLLWQRLGNLALHLANGAVLFFFLRTLFSACLHGGQARDRTVPRPSSLAWFALAGAALFVLHPAAVYGTTYLIQRTILMATLFTLLMWLLLLHGLARNSQPLLIGSALSYGLAVLSKEHAVMAPAVAAALVMLAAGREWRTIRKVLPAFVLYACIGAYIVFQVKDGNIIGAAYEPRGVDYLQALASTDSGFDPKMAYPLSVLTQSTLFFKYLLIWIIPNPLWMSVDMAEPFAMKLISWPHTAGFAAFAAYGLLALHWLLKRGEKGLLGLALLAPWLMFAAEFSTIRIQESFVIYRSYLWMPALFACLPVLFRSIAPARAALLLSGLLLVMLPVTWNRLATFSEELLLWNDAARLVGRNENRPGVERIFLNRGISSASDASSVRSMPVPP
jgi:hypothetical protein